ncbi:LemA family protein [Candidatus Woesearchaeota archaeon]|nr:LemA family protein [Candidatus Woesearchaeota archaeon]
MKKGTIIGIVIAAVLLLFVFWIVGSYNGLVRSDETVNEKWANVQSAYQRRADLIPNLVETVKQYSDYEGEVLTEITNARASIGKAGNPAELQAAGEELNSALARLLVVVENYPNLKANENYLSLQDELAGTENRIKVERDNFNKEVRNLNIKVRRFPTNIVAAMFGFEKREMFEADEGTENAPDVGELFN